MPIKVKSDSVIIGNLILKSVLILNFFMEGVGWDFKDLILLIRCKSLKKNIRHQKKHLKCIEFFNSLADLIRIIIDEIIILKVKIALKIVIKCGYLAFILNGK